MTNINLWGEIFHRAESLVPLIYLVISCYIIYLCFLKKELPKRERKKLSFIALTFMGVFVLMTSRVLICLTTGYSDDFLTKPILAANLIQIFLPLQIYNRIRAVGKEADYSSLTLISSAIFILNILFMAFMFYYRIESNLILMIIISLILTVSFSAVIISGVKFYRLKVESDEDTFQKLINLSFLLGITLLLIAAYLLYIIYGNSGARINLFEAAFSILNFFIVIKLLSPYLNTGSFDIVLDDDKAKQILSGERRLNEETKNEEIRDRLIKYFESEKPYLRSDITIQEVSLYLYTNKSYISRVINDSYGHNFSQFVNYYRIEEAKRLFHNDTKLSIQQLCDLSGFGSMATFTIAFRFFVGRSPADWCKDQKMKMYHEKEYGKDCRR